jgi:hypothetical protein
VTIKDMLPIQEAVLVGHDFIVISSCAERGQAKQILPKAKSTKQVQANHCCAWYAHFAGFFSI